MCLSVLCRCSYTLVWEPVGVEADGKPVFLNINNIKFNKTNALAVSVAQNFSVYRIPALLYLAKFLKTIQNAVPITWKGISDWIFQHYLHSFPLEIADSRYGNFFSFRLDSDILEKTSDEVATLGKQELEQIFRWKARASGVGKRSEERRVGKECLE